MKPLNSLLALSLALTCASYGQTTGSRDTFLNFLTPQTNLGFNLTQGVEYDLNSDLQSPGQGDLSILRLNTAVSYSDNFQGSFYRLGGSYEYADYDWSATEYISQSNSFGFNGIGNYKFQEREPWGIFALSSLEWSAERNASFSDGFNFLVAVGPSYSPSRDLRLGLGIGILGQPDQALRYIPIPSIDWTINEHWSLRTFNGATVTYDLHGDKQTRFDFSAQYNSNFIALNSPVPPGRTGNNALEEQEVILTGGVTHQFDNPFFIRAYIQGTVYREYELRANGNKYLSFRTDPSIGIGFQIGASF